MTGLSDLTCVEKKIHEAEIPNVEESGENQLTTLATEVMDMPSCSSVVRRLFNDDSDNEEIRISPAKNSYKTMEIKTDITSPNIMDLIGEDPDSNSEEGDSAADNRRRLISKSARHARRNYIDSVVEHSEEPDNIEFMEKFETYLKKTMISTTNKDNSTIKKTIGHIIKYDDSYLHELLKKIPGFKLTQLLDFSSNNYVELVDPLDWLVSTCNEKPSRAVEKLKSLKHLRYQYIQLNVCWHL